MELFGDDFIEGSDFIRICRDWRIEEVENGYTARISTTFPDYKKFKEQITRAVKNSGAVQISSNPKTRGILNVWGTLDTYLLPLGFVIELEIMHNDLTDKELEQLYRETGSFYRDSDKLPGYCHMNVFSTTKQVESAEQLETILRKTISSNAKYLK